MVRTAVVGRVAPVRVSPDALSVDRDGRQVLLPGAGGVNLGVHAGDPVDSWLADHLMVGASVEDEGDQPAVPGSLHQLACIGNAVRDAAGRPLGVVAGKRGGLAPGFLPPNLVSVEVTDEDAGRLRPGDRVVVEAVGRGLGFPDLPEVGLMNLSPAALDLLPLRAAEGAGIAVAVRRVLPPARAGAGLGTDAWIGDLEFVGEPGDPAGLRFGDLVAFRDVDARFGRFYRPGFVSVGLVAHGPSPVPGHGVGVTLLVSGPAAQVWLDEQDDAGIGLRLRRRAERGAFD